MIFRRILALAVLVSLCMPGNAQTSRGKRINRKEAVRIQAQNEELRTRVDSLMNLVETLKNAAPKDDSGISLQRNKIEYTTEVTDSLLSQWYQKKQAKDEDIEGEIDSQHFTSNVPDSVLIDRLERMNSYITLPFNQTIKNYMILYSEKMPQKMERILGLSNYYFPIFEEVFARYELPLELKYMSVIESALNPVARSRVGALGLWQFMYNTGKSYGLNITSFVDERMDVEKAADAAARYLRDAYEVFGDWCLAISSYNCGPGNVNKAIRRAGGRRDFWSIYPYLPRETRGFMPAFVGAMYAMTYYKEYDLTPGETIMPLATDTMEVNRNLHFTQVNDVIGIPIDVLREMNPQYTHDIIPGAEGKYILKIPYDFTSAFIEKEDSLYAYKSDSLISQKVLKNISQGGNGSSTVYVVKNGDNLGKIASRYGVSVANLKKWNHINGSMIRVGQRLTIYSGKGPASSSKSTSSQSKASTASSTKPATETNSAGETVYTVKSGDTLYLIAKNFPGVSAEDLMSYNGISKNIRPGMKIRIPKK